MKLRKIPLRKCVACQEMIPKKQLIRIVRTPEAEIQLDVTGKKPGRGAYLCSKASCFKLVKKTRTLDKALKHHISDEIYTQLEEQFLRMDHPSSDDKEVNVDAK